MTGFDQRTAERLRAAIPQVLGALVRRYGQFEVCEDAVQDALLAATRQWPVEGVPENPRAWLTTVASRRVVDRVRADAARRQREDHVIALERDVPDTSDVDDTLTLLLLCCHPSLSPSSQVALTLRAVAGLTTTEIANAHFVPESTMAQRISRAKQTIRKAGSSFELPTGRDMDDRVRTVLQVLYLVFNEGYAASTGPDLMRVDLTSEAIRLGRAVHAQRPEDGEAAGLLALMLLTDSRRAVRVDATGALVPLAEQDRAKWDATLIAEGIDLITNALSSRPLGPYQVQAAIAAVHAEAPDFAATDWPQIVALYGVLEQLTPNPMVTLNQAVAVAMVHGASAGLAIIDSVQDDPRLRGHHRLHAVRAHLLESAGDHSQSATEFRLAARLTTSFPEQRHLSARAARAEHGPRPARPATRWPPRR